MPIFTLTSSGVISITTRDEKTRIPYNPLESALSCLLMPLPMSKISLSPTDHIDP